MAANKILRVTSLATVTRRGSPQFFNLSRYGNKELPCTQ